MRYLVISDTHGDTSRADWILQLFLGRIDGVIHLGDHAADYEWLQKRYQDSQGLAFLGIRGNCDPGSGLPAERSFTAEGRKVFLCHGKEYGVKYGLEALEEQARREQATVVLFGHTHIPFCEEKAGVLYLNPGSLNEPRGGSRAGFALLEIEKGKAAAILNRYEDFA